MATLSTEQLRRVLGDVLAAGIAQDSTRLVAGMQPVFASGDPGDLYRLLQALVAVVACTFPQPKSCPTHGEHSDCQPVYTFGALPLVDGRPDWSAVREGDAPSLPPGFEARHPETVAYMRLITAQLAGDEDTSVAVWCAAVAAGHGPDVLYRAIGTASQVVRANRARLS